MSFKEITIKDIGNTTSFTRTSIYNYFQTKEEIFLALLQKEYELWVHRLRQIRAEHERMNGEKFADALAHSLEERENLLKIMSMNHYDMEDNSRMERLIEFKVVYGQSLKEVRVWDLSIYGGNGKAERSNEAGGCQLCVSVDL